MISWRYAIQIHFRFHCSNQLPWRSGPRGWGVVGTVF